MTDFSSVPPGSIQWWEEEDIRKREFAMRLALLFGDTGDETDREKDESPDMPGIDQSP